MSYYQNNTEAHHLHLALINLYLSLKSELPETHSIETKEPILLKVNPLILLQYIKDTIKILINVKVKEKLEKMKKGRILLKSNSIENLTQNLEAEIRSHIRV